MLVVTLVQVCHCCLFVVVFFVVVVVCFLLFVCCCCCFVAVVVCLLWFFVCCCCCLFVVVSLLVVVDVVVVVCCCCCLLLLLLLSFVVVVCCTMFCLYQSNNNTNISLSLSLLQVTTLAMPLTTTLKQYGSQMVRLLLECNGLALNSTTPFPSAPFALRRKSINPNVRRRRSTSKARVRNISEPSKQCGCCVIQCRRAISEHMAT